MSAWIAILLLLWTVASCGFMLHLDNEIKETRHAIGALYRRMKEKGIDL